VIRISIKLATGTMLNQIVLMEDIFQGERVRKFVLEGKTAIGWETIFEGSCIGHKFIHCFENMEVYSVRLKVTEAKMEPQILDFAVFSILEM
jgi:hypothetical protein